MKILNGVRIFSLILNTIITAQNIWYLSDIVSIYTLRDDGLTKTIERKGKRKTLYSGYKKKR